MKEETLKADQLSEKNWDKILTREYVASLVQNHNAGLGGGFVFGTLPEGKTYSLDKKEILDRAEERGMISRTVEKVEIPEEFMF